MHDSRMNPFLKHHQTVKEDRDFLQNLIPVDWMLSYGQNMDGISLFDLPERDTPLL
jgi:hypothetical protein